VTILTATAAVAVFGFLSLGRFPVELLPDVSYPTLTVQTTYPDAAPESVEQLVTRPLEESVGVITGIRDLRSTSRAGLSEVVLEFEWGQAMDFAALDVREKLGQVQLPLEAERPRVLRFDPTLDPIIRMALTGDRPLDELRQLAERWIKPRFEAVRGVAAAKVRGGLDPEIHVDVDIARLAALGLDLDDVASALTSQNVNRPGGTVKDWGSVYLVRTLHEYDDLEQVARTIVRETDTGRVRIEDVARVTRGHVDRDVITRNAGVEGVEFALHREGSANTMAVSEAIREELTRLRTELPADMELTLLNDQSQYISAAVSQVWSAALIGGLLAVLVLFFFLRDVPSTLIIALSIPASVVATFLPLSRTGVSLNIMSLGGLALGAGMLVDNSIVVLEAIDRRRREGLTRREAAARGAGEVAGAVTAATLTTVSVFLPIVFVTGIAGQLFYDLAMTVCLSLLASLAVSLTIIPTLSAIDLSALGRTGGETLFHWDRDSGQGGQRPFTLRLGRLVLPPVGDGTHLFSRLLTVLLTLPRLVLALALGVVLGLWWLVSWSFHGVAWPVARAFDALGAVYPGGLRGALRVRWLLLPATFALLFVAVQAAASLGTSLVPDLSQGEFAFQCRLPEETTLETTSSVVERIEDQLADDERFARVFSVVGSLPSTASGRQTLGENLAQIDVVLPDDATPEDEAAAIERVRDVLAVFPSIDAEFVQPSVMSVKPPIEVKVFSEELNTLELASGLVADTVAAVDGVRDVASTVEPGSPEVRLTIDRERAGALGVPVDDLSRMLASQIRGLVVGEFREGEERLDIRLRAQASERDRASEVADLSFRLPGGTSVPISSVAEVDIRRAPAAIYRADGARVARITAHAGARDLGRALDELQAGLTGLELPLGAGVELGGQNDELQVSFDSLRLALALAVFLVFVVMAMQFESLVHPFVILLTVPLGAVGVVAALMLTGEGISVLSLIGSVMLAGIVVNNAIVLVDAINRRRRAGEELVAAIVAGGEERLRPILMTTATTVLALLPMALSLGEGDELRRPMAITVIGGLSVSTLLTLLVIPCMYRVLTRPGQRLRPLTDDADSPLPSHESSQDSDAHTSAREGGTSAAPGGGELLTAAQAPSPIATAQPAGPNAEPAT
jgi:HAE1 family hydrophobic/amphiphilic exporter-1